MKKINTMIILVLSLTGSVSIAQTVTDFTKKDCSSGKVYNLFTELDSNKAIIMEFFHTCATCSQAAATIKPMYQRLVLNYGNKVNFFVMPGDDSFDCSQVLGWANTSGVSSIVVPFDSGSVQTAYYGGMAMPTIAVVAGKKHKILYLCNPNTASFATSDTSVIDLEIRHFLDSTFAGVPDINSNISYANVCPNPATNKISITIETKESGILKLELLDITGQKVEELTNKKVQTGIWHEEFPLSLSNGTYFIQGRFNEYSFQRKVIVLH